MLIKIIFLFSNLILKDVLTLDSCGKQITCNDCIRDASACVWCSSIDYNGTRCMPAVSVEEDWCQDSLENPKNEMEKIEERVFSSHPSNITQISPQRIHLKLRPGQPLDFPFYFKATKNYPVDLYFLLDVSKSMIKFKSATADQSENIYETMKNMTNDVYLGLGTFIDKNTLPYVLNFTSNNLTYSFRHHLSLMNDYKKFKNETDATLIGDNRDNPEGGLDALAQIMSCKEIIGWRNISRKIIVFLTDGPYHAAGDGKAAGIFQPYDGECYTENGIYNKELEMDYPSVSMINKLAREKDMIVIFAVIHELWDMYLRLSSAITGSRIVTLAENDNIGKTLKDIYEKITAKVKLNWYIKSGRKSNFEISFKPDCTLPLDECILSTGKLHNFTATIKLREYDEIDRAAIDIVIEGFNEKLALDIEVIKDCNCTSNVVTNSSSCHNEERECGVCKCGSNRYGDRCACVRNAINNTVGSSCFSGNMTAACNGKGSCNCGACNCMGGFGGSYCECNLNSCPLDDRGFLCGGKDRGECQCDSKCKCAPGWSGDACMCDDELCITNETVCNNRGECNCGNCKCNGTESWDSRKDQDKYCVIKPCPECHNLQCKILQDCALCYIKSYPDCPCSFIEYEIFDELPVIFLNSTEWNVCPDLRVGVGCYTNFTYKYDDEHYKIVLKLQKKMDCVKLQYTYGAIFLLSLVLLGIFTLVAWKLFTECRDRHEYLRFEKDYQDIISEKSENPVYQPAVTSYPNPTFGKRSITR